jgi:hypothetical protein
LIKTEITMNTAAIKVQRPIRGATYLTHVSYLIFATDRFASNTPEVGIIEFDIPSPN